MADLTAIGPGTRVLDVGCGSGGFCELAAARGAAVHGLDVKPARLAAARRRVPAGEFRTGLLEALPWPEASFDVVTGFNSFQYALDVEIALAEAHRVTRPGGRLAVCKWGPPAANELLRFLGALQDVRLEELPGTDPVDRALDRLGSRVLGAGEVPAVVEMADEEALAAALAAAGGGPDPATRLARVVATAAPFRTPGGGYRFRAVLMYRIVAGGLSARPGA